MEIDIFNDSLPFQNCLTTKRKILLSKLFHRLPTAGQQEVGFFFFLLGPSCRNSIKIAESWTLWDSWDSWDSLRLFETLWDSWDSLRLFETLEYLWDFLSIFETRHFGLFETLYNSWDSDIFQAGKAQSALKIGDEFSHPTYYIPHQIPNLSHIM